jgi:transcription antitermination factor NusG
MGVQGESRFVLASGTFMPDWVLATTPPNAEHLVTVDLHRCGYPYKIFKRSVTRAYHGRVIHSLRPAFPRYLFVPFEQAWDVLHDVWRVLGIVCFSEQVARVPEREIDLLVTRCNGGNVLPLEKTPELFAQGEKVHVGGYGLIAGHDALYQGVVEDGKLRVLFDMLGRMVPIDVDQRDVFAVQRHRRRRRSGRRNHRKAEAATDHCPAL